MQPASSKSSPVLLSPLRLGRLTLAFTIRLRHHRGTMISLPLPPESVFSRAVFKLIRPHIPRERWPVDSVRARFACTGDGLWLDVELDGFSHANARLAADLVRQAGVELVLLSPAAGFAAAVVRVKRWRDFSLFTFLPLLFTIPLAGGFSEAAMTMAAAACGLNSLALLTLQIALLRRRAAMAEARFVAHIPAPGLKITLGARRGGDSLGVAEMPEV